MSLVVRTSNYSHVKHRLSRAPAEDVFEQKNDPRNDLEVSYDAQNFGIIVVVDLQNHEGREHEDQDDIDAKCNEAVGFRGRN